MAAGCGNPVIPRANIIISFSILSF